MNLLESIFPIRADSWKNVESLIYDLGQIALKKNAPFVQIAFAQIAIKRLDIMRNSNFDVGAKHSGNQH